MNPFHAASADIRREGEELFAEVVRGSKTRPPAALAAELPNLLWTYSMGIVLYWIHDRSPRRGKTRHLIEHTVDLIAASIRLAANPLLRPFQTKVLALSRDVQVGNAVTAARAPSRPR